MFLFFEKPLEKASSPRSALLGHLVALAVGSVSLSLFGLLDAPSVLEAGVTGALLPLARGSHPPAGATTLIKPGTPRHPAPPVLFVMVLGVVLLTAASWALNRASGIPVSFNGGDG